MGSEALRQAAKEALQQNQLKEANALFRQAATAEGKDPDALVLQGLQALEKGKLERASESLRQALEANPIDLQALLGMARITMSLGQFQEAASLVSAAHQLDPSSGLAHSLGSMLFEIFGDQDAAAQAAHIGHELAPDDFFSIYTYARALARQNEDKKAIAHLEQALQRQPAHYGALYLLGILQTEQQAWRAALQTFQKAQQHHPAEPELYITIADVQWHRQQTQLAIEILLEGLQRCRSTIDIHHKIAQLYSRLQFYEDATKHLQLALGDEPNNISVLCSQAAVYWEAKELAQSVAVAEHVISLAPKTWQAHQLKAQCLHTEGKLEEAEASYQEAHKCHPKHPEPAGQWAMLLIQQNDPTRLPQAADLLQSAIRNAPQGEYAFHEALATLFDAMSLPHKARAVRRQIRS